VGSAEAARKVLGSENLFSVREYWDRMRGSFGETFLGMDRVPGRSDRPNRTARDDEYERLVGTGRYDAEATAPNAYVSSKGVDVAFLAARRSTEVCLGRLAKVAPSPKSVTVDVLDLASTVLFELAAEWFGLPPTDAMSNAPQVPPREDRSACPADFNLVSQFIFSPNPDPFTIAVGAARGKLLQETAKAFLKGGPSAPAGGLLSELAAQNYGEGDETAMRRTWTGTVSGFVVPTFGTFANVALEWIKTKDLWRLREWLRSKAGTTLRRGEPAGPEIENSRLAAALYRTMVHNPVPDLLHREAIGDVTITVADSDGLTRVIRIDAGDRVVVGLGSAAVDAPGDYTLLFGGKHNPGSAPTHACPGRNLAIGVLLGLLVGVAKQLGLRASPLGPQMLSFDAEVPAPA
jgi:hypothetical protein